MEGLVITSRGAEEAASAEIRELIDASCKIHDSCVSFGFRGFRDLCLLCYRCQSADRVLYLIGSFEFKNFFEELKDFIQKLDFGEWAGKYSKFRVDCIRTGTHEFKSVDVESNAAELILAKSKKLKVGMKDYDVIFLLYVIGNKCYLGVDFAGFELNKRSYKIFTHPNSLRGTIAYSLVRESGFKKGDIVLDPFSRDGVIAIEAAMYAANFPVNFYKKDRFAFLKLKLGIDFEKFFKSADNKIEKADAGIHSYDHLFKYVDYSKKNAKIAGVDKEISFSRVELEWLDIRFKENSVDRIVTNPVTSKKANLEKIYNEFFYQAEYILKSSGAIGIICKNSSLIKKHAASHNFAVAKEKDVWSGEQQLKIIVFKKKNI